MRRGILIAAVAATAAACGTRDDVKPQPSAPAAPSAPLPVPGAFRYEAMNKLVQEATFGISILARDYDERTRTWRYGRDYLNVTYWLEVIVDEESGEDGAAMPAAQRIPVFQAAGGRHPRLLDELPGLTVSGGEGWEAWFGNDTDELRDNELTFHRWRDDRLELTWTARYHGAEMELEGGVRFDGVRVYVLDEAHADGFLRAALGDAYAAQLERVPEDYPAPRTVADGQAPHFPVHYRLRAR